MLSCHHWPYHAGLTAGLWWWAAFHQQVWDQQGRQSVASPPGSSTSAAHSASRSGFDERGCAPRRAEGLCLPPERIQTSKHFMWWNCKSNERTSPFCHSLQFKKKTNIFEAAILTKTTFGSLTSIKSGLCPMAAIPCSAFTSATSTLCNNYEEN